MAKPRKTEIPEEVMEWINPDMDEETSSGKGTNEEEQSESSPDGIGAGGFTNSPLVTYTKLSPFKNSPRNQSISKIIIHHMAGVASVESFGTIVTTPGREMSANYAIGNDGRIGLYCDEEDRCWCSSSPWADNRGIAIEVSNSKLGGDWPISKKAWDSMIELCADICRRNNIPKLTYTGDQNGSLCFHRFFAATGCVPIDTTEVLTPTGWVPIRDVKVGELIANVSPDDFSIKFGAIENMTPVHNDVTYTVDDMCVTGEHRVLHSIDGGGYKLAEFRKICDSRFSVPTAGRYEPEGRSLGMQISSSEMIFLLEVQRIGVVENGTIEFRYIVETKVGYMRGLLDNIGYRYTMTHEDLGPVKFVIYDKRAIDLCKKYLSGKDFNWNWLEMNPTQFSYFIYKITKHVETGWTRQYKSDSMVNIDIVQALCALNERGAKYDKSTQTLYIGDGYKTLDPTRGRISADEEVSVACVTVKSGCFLMRQNGMTFVTGNCPGEYIFSRAQKICDEVNAKLGEPTPAPDPEPIIVPVTLKPGVLVSIASDATYYNGSAIPSWVKSQRWYVSSIANDRVVIGKNESGNSDINSPIAAKYLTVVQNASAQPTVTFKPYLSKHSAGTYIYDIITERVIDTIKVSSVYTIVEQRVVNNIRYGKLKSGAGWVRLGSDTTQPIDTTINSGDTVAVICNGNTAETYDGGKFYVYEKTYKVLRVTGDRVVISSDGKNVTAAVKASILRKK